MIADGPISPRLELGWFLRLMEGQTYVALAADGLLAVELGGEGLERGLNDTTTQTQDEVKGGLL